MSVVLSNSIHAIAITPRDALPCFKRTAVLFHKNEELSVGMPEKKQKGITAHVGSDVFSPPYSRFSTTCSACAVHVPYSKTACHSFHSAMSSLALPQRVPGSLLINRPEKGSSVWQRQRERAKSRIRTNQIVLPHAFPPPVIVFFAAETTLFLLHQKKKG